MTARRAFALCLLLPFAAVHGGSATPPDATLAGTVTDGKGRPLADAEVRLELQRTGEGRSAEIGLPLAPSRRTRTDARGGFRFDGLCGDCDYAVRASRPGLAPEVLPFTTPWQGGGMPALRLALHPGRTAFGTVVDPEGRPVSGISVELVRPASETPGSPLGDAGPYRAVTGPEGRFEIPDLPSGQFILGMARPRLPLSRVRRVRIPDGTGRTDLGSLEIAAGRTVAGRVLDLREQPLAGVGVWVLPDDDDVLQATWDRQIEAGPPAVTGPDGRYEIPGVATEGLRFCRTGYQPGYLSSSGEVKLEPSIAGLPSRVAGRVVTASGEPVAGAAVSLQSTGTVCGGTGRRSFSPCPFKREPLPGAVTGADGRFVLNLTGSGITKIRTRPPGFLEAGRDGLEYGPGREPFVQLVVQQGTVVAGRILTAAGAPAAGAQVSVEGVKGTAGEDGSFRLAGIEPGRRSLYVWHREHGQTARRLDVAPGETRLDVTLKHGARVIHGRALGPGGEPLAGVRVSLSCSKSRDTAWSAGDGSFVLADTAKCQGVWAKLAGFVSGYAQLPWGGSSVDDLEIRLERGIVLTGRILDLPEQNKSLDSFWEQWGTLPVHVVARLPNGETRSASLDRDGSYRFQDLSPGEWEVTAGFFGRRRSERIALEAGTEEAALDIRLPPAYEVQGRIVDGAGQPVRGHLQFLSESSPEDQIAAAASREDGSFITWVQEGDYTLQAIAPGLAPGKAALHVDGPVSGVEIRLEEGTVLRGRLLGIVPDPAFTVLSTRNERRAEVAPDGTFRMTGLGPGNWDLEASHRDSNGALRTARTPIEIAPGSLEAVRDIDLAMGDLALSGRLLAGGELVSARLELVRSDGVEIETGAVSPDGDFRASGLAPGRYRINVIDSWSGRRLLTREVELDRDQKMEIEMGGEP